MKPTAKCSNCYGRGFAHGFECLDCEGSGKVPVECSDCREAGFAEPAALICPDGKARCEDCASDMSEGARALLALIASRSKDATVDLLCQGALRLVHDISPRRA